MNVLGNQHNILLQNQADEIIQRTMFRLFWNNIYLISGQTAVDNIEHLQWIVNHIRHDCNRIVVLTAESEFTHLIVAKSANISHLSVNQVLRPLIDSYSGQISGSKSFAQATFYKQDIAPDIIDNVVESIIIALPYH